MLFCQKGIEPKSIINKLLKEFEEARIKHEMMELSY